MACLAGTAPRTLDLARKQNAGTLFYEPMFTDMASRYLEIQNTGDKEALQRFVEECEQSRLDRLNVCPPLWASSFSVYSVD